MKKILENEFLEQKQQQENNENSIGRHCFFATLLKKCLYRRCQNKIVRILSRALTHTNTHKNLILN